MNRKDILFRRALMAREIRRDKAAELFSKGAWLPVMKHVSTYSSNGYYYTSVSGGVIAGTTTTATQSGNLPGNIAFESGHSYLISVRLEGYTRYYEPGQSDNIRFMVRDPNKNIVDWVFKRTSYDTITTYMIDTYTCPYNQGTVALSLTDVQYWAAYSSTPFTMYSSVKKIS